MKKINPLSWILSPLQGERGYNDIKWFTLVEMIVSITISIFLLASISLFMWNWIKNITFQKGFLEALKENSNIYYNINKKISWASSYTFSSSSWFIIKINRKNDKWWFTYIWEQNFNKKYCQTWSLDTNHLIIKTFIPFESIWADFLAWTSYSSWWIIIKFFTWSISWWWITWNFSWPTDYLKNWTNIYISDTLDHTIKNWVWNVIIWKSWIFWNYFEEGISATKVLLNNPTGLAFWEWKLFFSDSLNDRILYLDSWKIYSLLDKFDWLNEPTWLFYDDSRKALFIANSGSGNILEYSSSWTTQKPKWNLEFKPDSDITNIDNLKVEFLNSSWTGGTIELTWPYLTGSFTFNQWIYDIDSLLFSGSTLTYFFEDYFNYNAQAFTECNTSPFPNYDKVDINNNRIKCINSWTWILWVPRNVTFSSSTNYKIDISDIEWTFPEDNYFMKLDLRENTTSKYTKNFRYFSNSDNDITTKNDNTLREVVSGLAYPTWIEVSWNNLIINSFLDRKQHTINLTTLSDSTTNLTWFLNFKNLDYNSNSDFVSSFPIKKLDFGYDTSNNLLSINLKTYKKYNCINNDENIEDIEVLKKVLK